MALILMYFSLCYVNLYSLGERQVVNLVKIAAFCKDTTLVEPQQAELKRQCLSYWEVPDKVRTAPPRVAPEAKCNEILKKIEVGSSGGGRMFALNITRLSPETLILIVSVDLFALICSTDK
jgi:cap1 methyltransferase